MAAKDFSQIIEEIVKRVNEHARRIRMLEERNRASGMRVTSMEEALLKIKDMVTEELEKISENIVEIERRIMKIENDIERINKELTKTAKKTEVKELEVLLNFFNPLKTKFVTKEEVEKMIKKYLKS